MFTGYRHESAVMAPVVPDFGEDTDKYQAKGHRNTFSHTAKGSFWGTSDVATLRDCSTAGAFSGEPPPDYDLPHKYATRARTARASHHSYTRTHSNGFEICDEDAATVTAEADKAAQQAEAVVLRAKRSLKRVAAEMQSTSQHSDGAGSYESEDNVRYHTRSCDHQPRKAVKTCIEPVAPLARSSAKGLRHFSMKVCEKVESKGRTTYNEVADELVHELSQADDGDDHNWPQYDEKNIRRRVYDALNVLMAMDIIEKEKKEIIWKGLPSFAGNSVDKLQTEKLQRAAELDRKQAHLQELLEQHQALKKLLIRNQNRIPSSAGTLLHLPFILVQTKPDATVEIQISDDQLDVQFDCEKPFQLQDDGFVLRQLAANMDDGADPSPCNHSPVLKHEDIGMYGSPPAPQSSCAAPDSRLPTTAGGRHAPSMYTSPQLCNTSKTHLHPGHLPHLTLDDMDPNSPAVVAIPQHMGPIGLSPAYLHNMYAAPGMYAVES